MNTKRTPSFIKLKHAINSCLNAEQLKTLDSLIDSYWDKHDDGRELHLDYLKKRTELYPYDLDGSINRASVIKSVCTCMAFHKSDECYKLGCKVHRRDEAFDKFDFEDDSIESVLHRNSCGFKD